MSLLCWTFQFIMQLFDMKTFFFLYFISVWHRVQQVLVLDPTFYFTQKVQITSSRRPLQVDGRSLHFNWQVVEGNRRFNKCHGMLYLKCFHSYISKTTDTCFYNLLIRQMEWEHFWGNEARHLAALHQEKKRNKLFGWLHSLNAHIISVIFSPAQCCWCRSACWWHAENVLHSFLRELVSKSLGGFLILLHQNRTRFP